MIRYGGIAEMRSYRMEKGWNGGPLTSEGEMHGLVQKMVEEARIRYGISIIAVSELTLRENTPKFWEITASVLPATSDENLENLLDILHCWHGSHITGVLVRQEEVIGSPAQDMKNSEVTIRFVDR